MYMKIVMENITTKKFKQRKTINQDKTIIWDANETIEC